MKFSDIKEESDRHRVDRDSLKKELEKLHESLRLIKDEAAHKYEAYKKEINHAVTTNEDSVRSLQRENERLKEEAATFKKQ